MQSKTYSTKSQAIHDLFATLFRLNEEPVNLSVGQSDIARSILDKELQRVWISTTTQYGKSLTVALSAIILAAIRKLKVLVIAPKKDQAKIIMRYVLEHVTDNEVFTDGLIDVTEIERMKTERSKERLSWNHGGEIMIGSAESHRTSDAGRGLLGFGADIIIVDESAEIPDDAFMFILRMLGRHANTKLVEISNPMARNHFYKASVSDKYYKIRIDYEQAIAEGRLTQTFIDEMKARMTSKMFKIMYAVEFPAENEFTYFKPTKWEQLPPYNTLKFYGACDPAMGESGKAGSLVGIVVLAVETQTAKIYEVESIGEVLTPDQTMSKILSFPYRFERFGIEAIQFQRYFFHEVEKRSREQKIYMPLVPLTQDRKKEERIESLEPYINTEQILFRGDNELWEEMQNYPKSAKLDVLDTCEMAWRLARGGGTSEVSSNDDIIDKSDFY